LLLLAITSVDRGETLLDFIVAFCLSLVAYLVLTAGSGNILLWSNAELILGTIFAVITALIVKSLFNKLNIKLSNKALNPKRWLLFLAYVFGPFALSLIKANIDVAYRVLTGKIKPAIVEIDPKLKNDFGITMLANSITLTPGTLTLEAKGGKLYIHWLNAKSEKPRIRQVCSSFADWIRRITE